ncbi:MAG: hypothetical protein Q9195_005472 [Heterodermia aff. obscurata]
MAASFTDELGFQTVHTPDHAVVDICFVHGLFGGRISTWSKGEVFWPFNLLAKDIPDARVVTWGYSADAVHFLSSTPTSANRVVDHARKLLVDLKTIRATEQTSRRPIIFISHSLGGLICAQGGMKSQFETISLATHEMFQGLLESSREDSDRALELPKYTGGLMFMGTPFEGSDTAKWASLFATMSKILPTAHINEELLEHLRPDSHDLKALGQAFPEWLMNHKGSAKPNIRVICFFEEFPTKQLGHVVTRESAQCDGCKTISLPADHKGMCKFDNFQDPKYKTVLAVLREWVADIKAASPTAQPKQPPRRTSIKMGNSYGGTMTGQDNSQNKKEGKFENTFVSRTVTEAVLVVSS